MALAKSGSMEFYDGPVNITDGNGKILDSFSSESYQDYIDEYSTEDTYCKFPYYKKSNHKDGAYRVGPIARLMGVR